MGEFAFQFASLMSESGLTEDGESDLGRRRSRFQLLQFCVVSLFDPAIELLDQMPHPHYLLVGGTQTQFLLMFHALAKMKHRFQGKTKGHILSSAMPIVLQ
jgi:hypothetical protein